MDEGTSTPLSYKIIGHLGKVLARPQGPSKTELKELDKDLSLLAQPDADALVEAGTLELLMRYLPVDQHFDVIAKCLMALSAYDSARNGLYAMGQNGVPHVSKAMFTTIRGAKAEKQIDKASQLGKILVLYCIDAPHEHLTWIPTLSDLLADSLEKGTLKIGHQDAYNYLSIALPAIWISMGTSLAPVIAKSIIDAGGMPLLLRVAKEVQRIDIKGLPKIIAEKALNLMCACNAEQPRLSLQQVDVAELAHFCVETTLKSDWVQSQELSIVLLGRLVFSQHALSEDYLETQPVVRMIQHALETKSPALRMSALCFSFICSEALFELVCVEANKVIVELGQGSLQSVKRLGGPSSGGMTIMRWGRGMNKFAKDLMKGSTLLSRMAEATPAHLPPQFVELLSGDLRQYVNSVKAVHGLEPVLPKKRSRSLPGVDSDDEYDAAEYQEELSKVAKVDSKAGPGASKPAAGATPPSTSAGNGSVVHQHMASMMADAHKPPGASAQPVLSGGSRPMALAQPDTNKSAGAGANAALKLPAGAGGLPLGPIPGSKLNQPPTTLSKVPSKASLDLNNVTHPGVAPANARAPQGGVGVTTSGGANSGDGQRGFSAKDVTQLNEFLFNIMMQKQDSLSQKASTALNHLISAMTNVSKLLPLKSRLPPASLEDCEIMLKGWAARVRQMGTALQTAQGPALDMLFNFSNLMLDEINAYLDEAERQTRV